jgi:cytochrome b
MTVPPSETHPARRQVLVWDAPVRVFHGLMVLCFAGAWLTAESERWRTLHVTLGYTMAGLVGFRIAWGLIGSHHARFSSFVRGPAAVAAYLRSLVRGHPDRYAGHTPAGAVAIVALLLLTLAVAASGWLAYNDLGGSSLEELVAVHVAAVLLTSLMHRENLLRAMLTGRKRGTPGDGIRHAWRSVAILVLAAVTGFWALQWRDTAADFAHRQTATETDDDQD